MQLNNMGLYNCIFVAYLVALYKQSRNEFTLTALAPIDF